MSASVDDQIGFMISPLQPIQLAVPNSLKGTVEYGKMWCGILWYGLDLWKPQQLPDPYHIIVDTGVDEQCDEGKRPYRPNYFLPYHVN